MIIIFWKITLSAFYVIHLLSILILIFFERKDRNSTLIWILVLTYIPIAGLILYLFFGQGLRIRSRKLLQLKKERDSTFEEAISQQRIEINKRKKDVHERKIQLNDNKMYEYYDLLLLNYQMSNSQYSQDNTLTIFTDATEKYKSLLKDIENAKETIHILYFIIRNDEAGKKIVHALTQKASEGVCVRLIYDSIGSFNTNPRLFKELREKGGKVYRFLPLRFGSFLKANHRNHRKIVVIDGKIAYTGGMNIGSEYEGKHKRICPWRDTHLKIIGTSVHSLQLRFLKDWYYVSSEDSIASFENMQLFFPCINGEGTIGMQFLSSGPDSGDQQIKRSLIKMIYMAKKSVYIQTPYLIPDNEFILAVQTAAKSGIEVSIMIPSIPDKHFVYAATKSFLNDFLSYGVNIYIYNGFLHSKLVIVDEKITTIGSTNIDMRSFSLQFEINGFIFDSACSHEFVEIFHNDLKKCRSLKPEEFEKRSMISKFFESIMRLFSPLM